MIVIIIKTSQLNETASILLNQKIYLIPFGRLGNKLDFLKQLQ